MKGALREFFSVRDFFSPEIVFILFSIVFCTVLFFVTLFVFAKQRYTNYVLKEIELEFSVPFGKDYCSDTILKKLQYGVICNKRVMRISLKKKFVKEDFLSSIRFGKCTAYAMIEPGFRGIAQKIEKFDIYYKDSLGKKLYMNECLKLIDNKVLYSCWGIDTMNNGLSWRERKEAPTLRTLISAINEKKDFTIGHGLHGDDLYYVPDEEMSRLLLNRNLYLDLKMGKVYKHVQIPQNKKVTITLYDDE